MFTTYQTFYNFGWNVSGNTNLGLPDRKISKPRNEFPGINGEQSVLFPTTFVSFRPDLTRIFLLISEMLCVWSILNVIHFLAKC